MRPLLVLLLLLLLTLPVFAQSPNNEIAVAYGSTSYSEDVGDIARQNTATLSYNRFLTPSISTRLGFTQFGAELAIDLGAGETDITATTLTAEDHHARGGFFSPFAGAGAAYIGAEIDTRDSPDAPMPSSPRWQSPALTSPSRAGSPSPSRRRTFRGSRSSRMGALST
ncbi:MAG TPA: hypothetical protein VE010_15385 [Thermoanaerobaculia bacterium]|nr:hypothetical protein [Thermoanaerobaculia bacterium]